jgi:hypothetical protein
MKRSTRIIIAVLIIAAPLLSIVANGQEIKTDPIGKWKAEVPYAPEGFQSSKLTIAKVDDKYTVEMNFEEMAFIIVGEKVTFIDKVLKFGFYVEEEDVTITLKFTSEDKLEGVVTTSQGDLPITALRIKEQK